MEKPLVTLIREAGVVGAGGAGFPTHVKVDAQPEYIIVNGAECEPLLRVDQQLMEQYGAELVSALKQVVKATGAQKGIIALKKKYQGASQELEKHIAAGDPVSLFLLGDFYPAGDEQVTVQEVLNRIVPEGGIPLQVKAVVINVETLLNLFFGLQGRPVTHKYLTITGEVAKPVTVRVPIGITVQEAIHLAGGPTVHPFAVIDGGPMMGKILSDISRPVTKTTKGLLVLPADHPLVQAKSRGLEKMLKQAQTACCHCSLCTEVCPRNLLGHQLHPDKLMRLASYGVTAERGTAATEAFLCCECGLCEQACVMGLQPWKLNQFLKKVMLQQGLKNPHHTAPESPHEFRAYRKFPVKKLISRLGLDAYNVAAPLTDLPEGLFSQVEIPLKQHIGVDCEPLVAEGAYVESGQQIGRIPEGKLGAGIHASLTGQVKQVKEDSVVIVVKT